MLKEQQEVRRFMQSVCAIEPPDYPSIPSIDEARLCCKLMQEELGETIEGLWKLAVNCPTNVTSTPSPMIARLTEVADGLADLMYVTLYTCNILGIDIQPIFEEVQRSNMTKIGGIKNSSGKLLKPDTYSPANIVPLIQEQLNHDA